MTWYVARSLNVLRDEINASAPHRNKASDGALGDAAHSTRTSDHNPCSCHAAVCARDITHDPAGGFDSYAFADWLRLRCQSGMENRVKYIISNSRIASGTSNNWNWRHYSGANPHNKHVHVSVAHPPFSFDNLMSWGWGQTTPELPPVEQPQGDIEVALCVQCDDGDSQQNFATFALNPGISIGWITSQTQVDVGKITGTLMFHGETGEPLNNFGHVELQDMIDRYWSGGPKPPGFH